MEEKTLPKLLVNMEVAERKIQERINKGQTFLNRQIDSDDELEIAGKEANNWSRYNIDLLIRLFDDLSLKDEYQNFHYSKLTFDEIDGMDALRLLAEEMVELNHFSSISHECIRQVLKKTNCVPGASSSGVSPQRLRRHS